MSNIKLIKQMEFDDDLSLQDLSINKQVFKIEDEEDENPE